MDKKFSFRKNSNPKESQVSCKRLNQSTPCSCAQRKIFSWKTQDVLEYLTIYVQEGANLNISKFVEHCFEKTLFRIDGSTILRLSLKQWKEIFLVDDQEDVFPNSPRLKRKKMANIANNQMRILNSLLN